MTHPNLTRAKKTGQVFYTIVLCGINQVRQPVRRTRQLQTGKSNKEEGQRGRWWCAALQLDRFYGQGPKRCPVGRSGMAGGVYYQALDGECGDDLLGSPAVVWHSYTMSHHHLSLVAMPTTLLQNRHVVIKYVRAILCSIS